MPEGIDSSYIVRVVIALLFVAGLIIAAVWAMRFRLNKMDYGTAQALRVRQKLAIDSKHSISVIEYGEQDWDAHYRLDHAAPNLGVNYAEFHEQELEGPYQIDGEAYFFDRKVGSWYSVESEDYVDEEKEARKNRRGMWRGSFIAPWEWRHQRRFFKKKITPKAQ